MDEELRGLERAARSQPDDAVAGRRYVEALERAGDRRGVYRELLARGARGDADARRDAWAWTRRRIGEARSRAVDARAPRAAAPRREGVERAQISVPEGVVPFAVTEHALGVAGGGALGVIRIADGSWAWRVEAPAISPALAAFRGDDVVHADASGIVLRAGEDGRILARVDLGGPPMALDVVLDSVLVRLEKPEEPSLYEGLRLRTESLFRFVDWGRRKARGGPIEVAERIDLSAARVAWSLPLLNQGLMVATASHVYAADLLAELGSGMLLWWTPLLMEESGSASRRPAPFETLGGMWSESVLLSDEAGFVFRSKSRDHGFAAPDGAFSFHPETGDERWYVRCDAQHTDDSFGRSQLDCTLGRTALGPDLVAFVRGHAVSGEELLALDRATGAILWRVPVWGVTDLVVTHDHVLALEHGGEAVSVLAHARDDGRVAWRARAPSPAPGCAMHLVPRSGSALVVAHGPGVLAWSEVGP